MANVFQRTGKITLEIQEIEEQIKKLNLQLSQLHNKFHSESDIETYTINNTTYKVGHCAGYTFVNRITPSNREIRIANIHDNEVVIQEYSQLYSDVEAVQAAIQARHRLKGE